MPQRLVQECINLTYRKAVNLAFWGLIDTCQSYDNYGPEIEGIINFLEHEKGIKARKIGSRAALDEKLRLYVYYPDPIFILTTLETYKEAIDSVPYDKHIFAELAAAAADKSWEAYKLFPLLAENFMLLPKIQQYTSVQSPLELEKMAKEALARGEWGEGKAATLALALATVEQLDVDKFVELFKESVGMALSVAHEAALVMMIGSLWRPGQGRQLLEKLSGMNRENRLVRIAEFVAEYLDTAHQLRDYMEEGDYGSIRAILGDGKAFITMGAHHAEVRVSGSKYIVTYNDHNLVRAEAIRKFFERLGFKVSREYKTVTIEVPYERRNEAIKAIVASTSIDVQECINIYLEASSVDELLELRSLCSAKEEEEWSNNEEY